MEVIEIPDNPSWKRRGSLGAERGIERNKMAVDGARTREIMSTAN